MFAFHSLRQPLRLLTGLVGPVSSVLLATSLLLPFAPTVHAQTSPSPLPVQSDVLGGASAVHVSLTGSDPSSTVTPDGAFTYTVPIDIPPGRHGMQPSLSLLYNSLNRDGLAGMGWSLAGIPVISRVAAQSGINYIGQDTYAVNLVGWGSADNPQNRLVDIGNGHYHTMDETWGDYQPQGKCGDGACYWILRDGGGTTWFFGGDAKFKSSPNTSFAPALWERDNGDVAHRGIFVWSLYKVVDLYGNAYQVLYSNPPDGSNRQITTPAANTLYTYYPDGLLKDLEATSVGSPSAQLQKDHYDYDPLGNVLAITDQRQQKQVNGINTDGSQSFTYDSTYRLIAANGTYGGQQYGYDAFGDITRLGAVTIQYNGRTVTGMQGQNVAFHEVYDAAGEVESKDDPSGHWAYQYDAWHQLTTGTRNGKLLLQLEYNFAGDRVKKVYASGKNGTLTTYYLDGYEIRESSKRPGAYSSTELIVAPGYGLIASITTGSIPGQPTLATVLKARGKALSGNTFAGPPEGTLFYLRNPISSTEVVTTADGQEVERAIYEPYGKISTSHSTGYDVSSGKFTGKELDEETNLTNYGARYYDDTTARFTTADLQVAGRASNPLNFNRYAYVRDNPLVYRDPTGFDPQAASQSWFLRLWNEIKPDFGTLSITYGPFGGSLTVDNNLNVYGSIVAPFSKESLVGPTLKLGVTLTVSRIFDTFEPRRLTEEEIKNFVAGMSGGIQGCLYVCAGNTFTGDERRFSLDVGGGPGIGVSGGLSGSKLLYERHKTPKVERITITPEEAQADFVEAEAELNGQTKSDVEFSVEEADPITTPFIDFSAEAPDTIVIFTDTQAEVIKGQINTPDIPDQEPGP